MERWHGLLQSQQGSLVFEERRHGLQCLLGSDGAWLFDCLSWQAVYRRQVIPRGKLGSGFAKPVIHDDKRKSLLLGGPAVVTADNVDKFNF